MTKDKFKGFIAGLSVAFVLCATTAYADKISKSLTAVYNDIKIVVDGKEVTPKDANGNVVEPFIIDGTTYLPVRAVAEALDEEVAWDNDTKTVYIGEVPQTKTKFSIDSSTLAEFTNLPLYTIGSQQLNGGIFNLLITENASDTYIQMYSDNYSPDKNLQTLMIDSQPAAKFFCDSFLSDLTSIFSIYDEAVKTGFINDNTVKTKLDFEWNTVYGSFPSDAEYKAFLSEMNISDSDMRKFVEAITIFSLYGDDLYNKKASAYYDTSAFEEEFRKNYITAKHILVEDETLAKEIINRLKKGESFDTLMSTYNIDNGEPSEGYTFTYGEMVEPFEKAAFALGINTFSQEPVKTNYGYHIIYRYPLSDNALFEAVKLYKNQIAQDETNNQLAEIIKNTLKTPHTNYEKYITTIK